MMTIDTPRFVRRLHREDRGNVWVMLMMFYIFVIFSSIGYTWNTSQVTTKSIQTQMIADVVAYNAALTNARAMNLAVATNVGITQHISANILLEASPLTLILIVYNWIQSIASATVFAPIVAGFCVAEFFAVVIDFLPGVINGIWELIFGTIDSIAGTGPPGTVAARVRELNDFQKKLIEVPDGVIERIVESYEERYNCDIVIGDRVEEESSGTEAPDREVDMGDLPLDTFSLVPSGASDLNRFDVALPLLIRVYRDHEYWYDKFAPVVFGRGQQAWRTCVMIFYLKNVLLLSHRTVALEDPVNLGGFSIPFMEWTPPFGTSGSGFPFMASGLPGAKSYGDYDSALASYDDNAGNDTFDKYALTVAVTLRNVGNAATERITDNLADSSAGRFGAKGRYLFDGWFNGGANWDDSTLAVASAEFYNPTMNRLTAPLDIPYPYRMFSTWGWNWQARLREVHPDFLGARINSDGEHIRLPSHHHYFMIGGGQNNHLPQDDGEYARRLRSLIYH